MQSSKENLSKIEKRFFKAHGYLPDDRSLLTESVESKSNNDSKITVLCVRFGTKYGQDYVERLRNMVSRHLTVPYEFVCLSDDPTKIQGVRTLYQKSAGYNRPWWHKVHMFDPNLDISGRILYLDLDVIICNNLDKLVNANNNHFYGIQDFNRKFYPKYHHLNSSVMSWVHRSNQDIYQKFMENKAGAQKLHGDQDWIWSIAKTRIKFWPINWIMSYKWEIRSREELLYRTGKRGFATVKNPTIPSDLSIAVFHGDPKPEDVTDPFVVDNWR